MKYWSALLFAGMFVTPAYAQNGFYVSPSIGMGISGPDESSRVIGTDGYTTVSHKNSIFSYNAQIGIGYRYKNWRFQSGIQYFKSGYQINNLVLAPGMNPYLPTVTNLGTYKLSINQVGIPLQIGYAIPLSNKLSLVPQLGVIACYSFSGSTQYEEQAGRTSLPGYALNDYGRFTFWGQAGVQLEYKLNNRFSLSGGPSLQYMLGGTGNNYSNSFYNLNFNLGLKINLGKGKN